MNEAHVFAANFERELTKGFQKEMPFNVAHGATDLGQDDTHIGISPREFVNARLDLIGDVGNELDGLPEIFASALLFDHIFEDLTGGEVVETGQHAVGEAFVVSEIEVCFRTVVEDVDFAVLVRRHRSGIDIEVGVELLDSHIETAMFEQGADGGGGQSLSKGRYHATGDKDVFQDRLLVIGGWLQGSGACGKKSF